MNGAVIAYIGLGSNLGDRAKNIQNAIDAMTSDSTQVCAVSQIYETAPHDVSEPQPNYFNAVIRIETQLTVTALHRMTMQIEHLLGRRDKGQRKPRTIDLDVLLYGEQTHTSDTLQIPHPRMLERPFVVVPLKEVLISGWPTTWPHIDTVCNGFTTTLTPIGSLVLP